MSTKKLTILLITSVVLGIGYALIFDKRGQAPPTPPQERIVGETIRTETVQCNDETYIFEMTLIEDRTGYFNNIYRNTISAEDFVTSIKAPPLGANAFYLLGAPKENCDRIYLTVVKYETSSPRKGIFEWRIGGNEASELAISKELFGHLAPYYPSDLKNAISSDGEKMIVAQLDERITTDKWSCDPRILKLLHLREDVPEILVQVPEEEVFTSSSDSDFEGFCIGIDFGWIDDSTIYYDVYDSTSDEWTHPFIERRTLKVE